MKQLFLILIFSVLTFCLGAQTADDYLKISGFIDDEKTSQPLPGVTVIVFEGKKPLQTVVTDSAGNYDLKSLELNHLYIIAFSKKKYCYKFATIDATNPAGELLDGSFPMEINTTLFKVGFFKRIKLRFMKTQPVAMAAYDSTEDYIMWNMEYIEAMAKKIGSARGKK
jgi:hypothetical protein